MLPPGSWLHLAVGCLFGISSTVFVSRVMRTWKHNFDKNPVHILGLYIFSVVVISFLYASALSGGLLTEWKLLGYPQFDDRAAKVLDIGYILGVSGNIYKDNQGTLEKVDAVIKDEDEYDVTQTMGNCGTLFFMPIYKRDFIDSKSACISIGPGLGLAKTVYAVDSGGHVFSWRHGSGKFSGIINLYFPFCGAVWSILFGLVVISIVNALHKKRE